MAFIDIAIGIGTVIGNVGGALAASILPEAIGGGAAGAGTLATMGAATLEGGAGSALAGTALAPEASTAALGNLANASATPAAETGATATPGATTPTAQTARQGLQSLAQSQTTPAQPALNAANTSLHSQMGTLAQSEPSLGQAENAVAQTSSKAVAPEGLFNTGVSTGSNTADKLIESQTLGAGVSGIKQGADTLQQNKTARAQNKGYQAVSAANAADAAQAQNMANTLFSGSPTSRGFSFSAAKGGEVHLKSGQFVIPADIVSALGNGDTDAGQKFLVDFFKDQA